MDPPRPQNMQQAPQQPQHIPQQHQQVPQQPQAPVYKPETVTLTRPQLNDFKRRIDTQMSADVVKSMLEDDKISMVLKTQLECESEIDALQKQVLKQVQEVKAMARENQEMNQKAQADYNAYNLKMERYEDLQVQNQVLKSDSNDKSISKAQVTQIISQKIKDQDKISKDLEKQFQKEKTLTSKEFISQFMKERIKYHKYQISKSKVENK